MNRRIQNIAAFTRGFFLFLEERNIRAAVLHGGGDAFERELSDVDFVVGNSDFGRLPELVASYCADSGWLFCQNLRHETTAAYLVCCAADDPSSVVALDACSDYQRNGVLFLNADELLGERRALPWGGSELSTGMELCYRFAKSAAKGKDAAASIAEFSKYPDEARTVCTDWLADRFGIQLGDWSEPAVSSALDSLRGCCRKRPPVARLDSLRRIVSRIVHPSGLLVVTGRNHFETTSEALKVVFGDVFFRRFRCERHWRPALVKDLIASTLIVVPELPFPWSALLPKNCMLDAGQATEPVAAAIVRRLADRLSARGA